MNACEPKLHLIHDYLNKHEYTEVIYRYNHTPGFKDALVLRCSCGCIAWKSKGRLAPLDVVNELSPLSEWYEDNLHPIIIAAVKHQANLYGVTLKDDRNEQKASKDSQLPK